MLQLQAIILLLRLIIIRQPHIRPPLLHLPTVMLQRAALTIIPQLLAIKNTLLLLVIMVGRAQQPRQPLIVPLIIQAAQAQCQGQQVHITIHRPPLQPPKLECHQEVLPQLRILQVEAARKHMHTCVQNAL